MTERTPLVSVIIDNYNYGRFLTQCIESVHNQDYPSDKIETIVVDDGSTDNSIQIAAQFEKRIKLIQQANAGQAAAFNAGIAAAQGDLVMLLDADDYWDRRRVSIAAEGFADSSVGIVQNLLAEVDAQGRDIRTPAPQWPTRYSIKDYLAGGAVLSAASGLALRRSVLMGIGPIPQDIYYASDIYLIAHALFISDALNVPAILGFHRVHGRNNWAGNLSSPQKLRMGLDIQRTFNRYLDEKIRAHGLELSPFYAFTQELDFGRREILLAMHEGNKQLARKLWHQLWKRYGTTRLGFFRCATLLLALISPSFYLSVYSFYENNRWPARLRQFLLPERQHSRPT